MYTYSDLLRDVEQFERLGGNVFEAGRSVAGRAIPAVGARRARLLIHAAIHAREYCTTQIVVQQIYHLLHNHPSLLKDVCFVPMVNPDGVELCTRGVGGLGRALRDYLLAINQSDCFVMWKSNLNAVDLNTNFCAEWGTGKQNLPFAHSENYIGARPESEPETQMLVNLTANMQPHLTISYHARGREIYWEFGQTGDNWIRDKRIADYVGALTGYKVVDGKLGSAGGYKDYCVLHYGIPALTIEVLPEQTDYPVPDSVLAQEMPRHICLPEQLLAYLDL